MLDATALNLATGHMEPRAEHLHIVVHFEVFLGIYYEFFATFRPRRIGGPRFVLLLATAHEATAVRIAHPTLAGVIPLLRRDYADRLRLRL